MTKKHFVALATTIKEHNERKLNAFGVNAGRMSFSEEEIDTLANFCQSQNSQFNRDRWISYIKGECGPSGGAIKP